MGNCHPRGTPAESVQRLCSKIFRNFERKQQDDVMAWLKKYQDTAEFNLWIPDEWGTRRVLGHAVERDIF